MAGQSEPLSRYRVHLHNEEHRRKWEELSRRNVFQTKVFSSKELRRLGLNDDFWKLCNLGFTDDPNEDVQHIGLSTLMCSDIVYRGYTLEFLSTLHVEKKGRPARVVKIIFRLGSQDRTLWPEQIRNIYRLQEGEEEEFDHHRFWKMITFEDRFISGKSKSSAIRNPVLRVLHRGISNAVFPRSDMGSVNNTELHLIYCLLRRKCNDLSKHLPLYWEKIVKPSTADILCGAHVTQILRALDVEERERDAIPGEKFITLEGLHNMDILKVDGKLRPYVFQAKAGDHFPLPCPRLTHIDDWDGDRRKLENGHSPPSMCHRSQPRLGRLEEACHPTDLSCPDPRRWSVF